MKLLIFNYSMNSTSLVFSHQRTIVEELSKNFSQIDVITAESFTDLPIDRVRVFSTRWKPRHRFSNTISFYRIAIPLLIQHRGGTLFSHMTEVQSFLTIIICKMLRIRHFLWYAHKSSSIYLYFCYPFLKAVITSTPGSCSIHGKKVIPIGQSIDVNLSNLITRDPKFPPKSWYHVGRIDQSKKIEVIAEALLPFNKVDSAITLHIYGSISSELSKGYFENLIKKFASSEYSKWVFFHGAIKNSDLAKISMEHDGFIHAFWGSLDKTVIEAIILKRIVISSNPEYLKEFFGEIHQTKDSLMELTRQLKVLYQSNKDEVTSEIDRKYQLAVANHALHSWIYKLINLLEEK